MNIEAKREAAAKAIESAKALAVETAELARLEATIKLAESGVLSQAYARQNASDELNRINTTCEQIVAELPIYSAKTKTDRKWNPSRQYGLGNQMAVVTGLLSGIQYSATEHKLQMLAFTGLNEDLIEQTLKAFGNTSYYSKNYTEIVPEEPYDVDAILANLALIENALSITIDKSDITEAKMAARFKRAAIVAEKNMNDDMLTIEASKTTINI